MYSVTDILMILTSFSNLCEVIEEILLLFVSNLSVVIYSQRGLVHAASAEWEEARQCFQNALAIHPTHLDSMVQLGEFVHIVQYY